MKRFSLRLEDELHEKLRVESFETGISMHEIIVKALEQKYKTEKEGLGMLKLIVRDHGEEEVIKEGTLIEIVEYLKENEELTNWVLDEDPDTELPVLDEIENIDDLEYELNKIDLDWWKLEIR